MDNTTDNQIMQGQLTPEEAKASLGLATRLSDQFMMSQVPQAQAQEPMEPPVEPQNAPQEENGTQDTKFSEIEGKMSQGFEDLRNELHATIKSEIGSIRDEIKNAIENEQD